ncbi:hypothetical protein BgAZ_402260 [Babesia gibsoni]|uniref:Uncharacterized protein n=1 Tax=Babesia gibsoni TaxID=33632 RepID=A0AAD8LNW0_BABGI|nr:hypothetical protein BgAZ_402260 [Babesia gibsoni]
MSFANLFLVSILTIQISYGTRTRISHRRAPSPGMGMPYNAVTMATHRTGYGFISPLDGNVSALKARLARSNNRLRPLKVISRTGVCVPEDIGLYGRTVAAYECLYSKDGETKTGDEWEYQQVTEADEKFRVKMKKPKKERALKKGSQETPEPLKRVIFPPPYNTTGMLLREGDPYLVLSSWLPGVEKDDILVIMDYAPNDDAFVPKRYDNENLRPLEVTDTTRKYYQSIESVPRGFEQHTQSYNSTYNDVFNQMVEGNEEMSHYSTYSKAKDRPPMFIINAPKNTVVKQFEFNTFGRKRDPNHPNRYNKSGLKVDPISDRIQRAYRPFSYVDLRNVQCNLMNGTLQIRVRLTHIPPPPDMRKIFHLEIGDNEFAPPRSFPVEQVHGWMYNWHHFHKYDLSFDVSQLERPEEPPEERDRMEIPDPDPMTRREAFRLIREYDEWHKKN